MIEWKKYNPYDRAIESHVDHLVTNGHQVVIARHAAKIMPDGSYGWHINSAVIGWVTHYAVIHLPQDLSQSSDLEKA